MIRDINSKLSALRISGEIKTGRQMAEALEKGGNLNLFPGECREEATEFGPCYLRELKIPLEHRHGSSNLSGILSCCGPDLSLPSRDKNMSDFNPRKSIFFDIETTGLGGGVGTWAFLIGMGWIEENFFLLRQYFLRRPAEERALLSHFTAAAACFPTMVTFNGKLFDLPLINTRQVLAGIKTTEPRQHLDLLQCARNLWKKRLVSRSLHSLEEALLNIKRDDDIPGSEIPAVYFNYLRRGETELLKKVFDHNALDILSMVSLLERVYRTSAGQLAGHPAELLALGCLCLETGRSEEGIGYLRAASKNTPDPLAEEAALKLALYFKRQGKWTEAVKIWEEVAETNFINPTVLVELAKYYEHQRREYRTALQLTEQALILAKLNRYSQSSINGELNPQALRHRMNRLSRRLLA